MFNTGQQDVLLQRMMLFARFLGLLSVFLGLLCVAAEDDAVRALFRSPTCNIEGLF